MEGVTVGMTETVANYYVYWTLYLAASVAGFWCWGKMAFWVETRGVAYHIYSAVGAVLIFTPLPVLSDAGQTLAPGFVALTFTLISDGFEGIRPFILWYAIAAGLAALATILGLLAGLAPENNVSQNNGRSEQEKSATQARKSVKGNPFA